MNLSNQRRISASLMKVGKNKVWFDKDRLEEVKEAITKADIQSLIKQLAIQKRPQKGTSRVRARKKQEQRRKGRQKGDKHKKGKATARLPRKEKWMITVRGQRKFITELKEKELVEVKTYRNLYQKVKGGYFRSKRHIKLYLTENKLFKEK
ncbi:MAG: 50S ribosomal protein L19e [archaeon]